MQDALKQAARYAKARGFHQEAEDFAQEAALKLSQGRKATFKQLFIDFLREQYGDNRNAVTDTRKAARTLYEELPETLSDRGHGEQSLLSDLRYSDAIGALDVEQRIMLILLIEWGLTAKEIGHCFGVSESRICQRLQGIYRKLKFRI